MDALHSLGLAQVLQTQQGNHEDPTICRTIQAYHEQLKAQQRAQQLSTQPKTRVDGVHSEEERTAPLAPEPPAATTVQTEDLLDLSALSS